MFDTTTLSTVPSHPFALAGYTAGHWPTYLELRAAWPTVHTISIAVQTRYHAGCLDVEPGDASPNQVVGWILAERADPGLPAAVRATPCVYSSYFEYVNQVRPLLAAAHIARSSVLEWDADYHGCNGVIDRTFDATQCTDTAFNSNLDESIVTLRFLSIATPPYLPPAPKPVVKPKPVAWTYTKAYDTGFDRGYDVRWLELHHRSVPAWSVHVPVASWTAVNVGFDAGFKAVRG